MRNVARNSNEHRVSSIISISSSNHRQSTTQGRCVPHVVLLSFVGFCVVLVLVVAWHTVVVAITLYCCICFFSCCCCCCCCCCCSCSCCCYCCRWCAVIVFFLCRRPLFVVHHHRLASILPLSLLSQCIVVSCCFVLFRVVSRCFAFFRVVSCCCCPCPCGCCVRISSSYIFFAVPSVLLFFQRCSDSILIRS